MIPLTTPLRRKTTQPQSFSSGFLGLGGGAYQQAFAEVINDALLATINSTVVDERFAVPPSENDLA